MQGTLFDFNQKKDQILCDQTSESPPLADRIIKFLPRHCPKFQLNEAQLPAVPGPEPINIKITRDRKSLTSPLPPSHQGANNPKAGDMKPRPPP